MTILDKIQKQSKVGLPDNILFNTELSANELRILMVLVRMAKDVVESGEGDVVTKEGNIIINVTRKDLASNVNLSIPTVLTSLNELKKAGYIRIMPQQSEGRGKFSTTPIILLDKMFN